MELQPILHVWLNHDNDLVDLTITTQTHPPLKASQHSEVVHTTQKHPFLTLEKGFLPVGQIKLGMHVLRADGSVGTITGWKVVPGSATMYNLEVAQDHTYTVGDGLWVVHNCASGGNKDLPKLDGTGKVHGALPNRIPDHWTNSDLEELESDLQQSIETRQEEQIRLGEDGPHRNRLRQEQQLLRQIQKRLSGS